MNTKKNYRELYKQIANAEWYKRAYHNKSIGETIRIE